MTRPPIIQQIRAEARGETYRPPRAAKRSKPTPPDPELARHHFTVYTGNRWMELGDRQPAPKMLFGHLWYQHEICFLFAGTNTGKSILAVQIGNAIARGSKTGPFPCEAPEAKVLYVDFELSNLQFHQRYSQKENHYEFPENFLRAQFNPAAENPDPDNIHYYQADEYLIAALEYRLQYLKATVLIIDNLSCLADGTTNARGAMRIMSSLNTLRAQYNLSILVLAHTPKRRNPGQPLSTADLAGSKLLINLADSAFTIGQSITNPHQRYLKQIKQRSTSQVYGGDNVCLCHIQKHGTFLKFEFTGHSAEQPLLLSTPDVHRRQLTEQIKQLIAQGYSQRQIAEKLNISLGLVNKLGRG